MSKGPTPFSRSTQFFLVAAGLTVGFLFVLIRLSVIQWMQYGKWEQIAKNQHERKISDHVERGTLYDRNGKMLAINIDVPSVYAIPNQIKDKEKAAKQLAPILNVRPRQLAEKLNRGRDFIWLARKIDPTDLARIEKLNIAGIDTLMESKRFYPKRALFGHLIGFVGIDNNGLEGIEHRYNEILKGEPGEVIVVRDAYGKSIYPKGFEFVPPSRGEDLHLTLDETIQHISTREIRNAVLKAKGKGGMALVIDPYTGAVLAMAVYPSFNPNAVNRYHPAEWRNRAITDIYEPGSTFKIVTAAAALEEKLVVPTDIIDCENGAYRVADTIVHDHDPIGKVPFYEVVARSSNIGMIKIADRLGEARMRQYTRSFGFGTRHHIDLTGESPGLLQPIDQWSKRTLASMAIGQEIGVTALQMVLATSIIANGGWQVTPHVVAPATTNLTETEGRNASRPVRVLSETTARAMTEILKGVVSAKGTGGRAMIPGFSVAGKTGTAQKIDLETGLYSKKGVVSSFVGFVPADRPVATILVMVDEPQKGHFGGEVAAPAFANIGREMLHYLKIRPQRELERKRIS